MKMKIKKTITLLLSTTAGLTLGTSVYSETQPKIGATAPIPSLTQVEGLGRGYLGIQLNWTTPRETIRCKIEQSISGHPNHESYTEGEKPNELKMNLPPGVTHKIRVKAEGPTGTYGDWAESSFEVNQDGEKSKAIEWSGKWTSLPWHGWRNWGAFDQWVHTTSTQGDIATYTFTGTAVAWIADRGSQMGKADIYLDQIKVDSVDLNSDETRYAEVVYSKNNLSPKKHTLQIKVTSTDQPVNVFFFARIFTH